MKKIYSFLIVLVLALTVYFVSENHPTFAKTEPSILELYKSDSVYQEVNEKYGVYSMAVSQSENTLVIGMDISNKQYKDDVQKYFSKKLIDLGIDDYDIEIHVYKNGTESVE